LRTKLVGRAVEGFRGDMVLATKFSFVLRSLTLKR
jgi:hypothetical protein